MNPRSHLSWALVASVGVVCGLARAEEGCELGAFGCQHEQNHDQYEGWTDMDGCLAATGRTAVQCGRRRMKTEIGKFISLSSRACRGRRIYVVAGSGYREISSMH
jgi:hypothetical protein